MPSLREAQDQFLQQMTELKHLQNRISADRNHLRRLKIKTDKINRFNPSDNERGTLETQKDILQRTLQSNKQRRTRLLEAIAGLQKQFEALSDPRRHLSQMRDDLPILMFPLKLETRFKEIRNDNNEVSHQLWIRAYPDTCLIDSFESLPSEAEYRRAKNYWIKLYQIGIVSEGADENHLQWMKEQHLSAWTFLMEQSTAGRAFWLQKTIQPLGNNLSIRTDISDIILVIPFETNQLDTAQQQTLTTYWTEVWTSQGDPAILEQARASFETSIGDKAIAARLIEQFAPAGIPEEGPQFAVPNQRVEVVFLEFKEDIKVDRTLNAWSQPVRSELLPDRLVIQGFTNGKKVIDQIGPLIPQPLVIGPDPDEDLESVLEEAFPDDFQNMSAEEKAEAYVNYLRSRSETQWLFDFEAAIDKGMGFKIDLSPVEYRQGLDRLFVMGVRLCSSAETSKTELEDLFLHHQYGSNGLSFLPQGLATNRTDEETSTFTQYEDAAASFERLIANPVQAGVPDQREQRTDGRWFCDLLGIDPTDSGLSTAVYFSGTNQRESFAMQRALYPATAGYYLEAMLSPLVQEWPRDVCESFFNKHVTGRGRIPSIRIGNQPYGILPVNGKKKGEWLQGNFTEEVRFSIGGISDHAPVLQQLLGILEKVREDWTEHLGSVAHLHKPGADPHQVLLDVLGLHATSVEFRQRMGQSASQLINQMKVKGLGGVFLAALIAGGYMERTRLLLLELGVDVNTILSELNNDEEEKIELPALLRTLFFQKPTLIDGPLIDDLPLSEENLIRSYTDDNKNYIEWLIEVLQNSPRKIKTQSGFSNNERPRALLYQLLRHATELRSADAGIKLYEQNDLLTRREANQIRINREFIGIRQNIGNAVESPYELLYRPESRFTADNQMVVDHLATLLSPQATAPSGWQEHLQALQELQSLPTAKLERLMAEHLDCCTYRIDAWLQSFTNLQLYGMRYGSEFTGEENWRSGIYLGAYGWVENLKPQTRNRRPAELTPEQQQVFNPDNTITPETDDSNGGFVHAPSLDHATTAAVLRNAYIGQSNADEPDRYAINLSSERVRMAMQIIQGMQRGQDLGALLGYQLERGLHDNTNQNLDVFIYELRKAFPLRANKLKDTEVEESDLDSIEQIAADNVVDGLALIEHIRKNGGQYPWDKNLRGATNAERDAIMNQVDRIANINDAVADLELAESVHQVVKGNFDRAAGTLNAFSKGGIPPTPDIVKTPRRGTQLSHRFALHLDTQAISSGSILHKAEPALANWIESILPDADKIGVVVSIDDKTNPPVKSTITLAQLNFSTTDLLYLLDREGGQNMGGLDEIIYHHIQSTQTLSPLAEIHLLYTETPTTEASCFELIPILQDLRDLLLGSRPLRPTDLKLATEANTVDDQNIIFNTQIYLNTKDALDTTSAALQSQVSQPLLDAGVDADDLSVMSGLRDTVKDNIDNWVTIFADAIRPLQYFRPVNARTQIAYEGRRNLFLYNQKLIADFKDGLADLLDQANELNIAVGNSIDPEEILLMLRRMEALLSTEITVDEAALPTSVANKLTSFSDFLDQIQSWLDMPHTGVKAQLDTLQPLLDALPPFTSRRVDLAESNNRLLVLAQDILRNATQIQSKATLLIQEGDLLLANAIALAPGRQKITSLYDAVKQLLGKDFQLLARFEMSTSTQEEFQNGWDNRNQLLDYQQNTIGDPFPVDTWMHGLARVRKAMGEWERTLLYTENYTDAPELNIAPLQFPFQENDHWLGMEFPEAYVLENERLLYTAHYVQPPTQPQVCGLLLDEWTEVIPARKEDTGLTFHFDRPNNEAPQVCLLALPKEFNGRWDWNDLVECLHEALDLAKLRAIEPEHFSKTGYAHLLPATLSTVSSSPASMHLNYANVNQQITIHENFNFNETS